MRPEVHGIEANDIPGWPRWQSPTPQDELQWFTVSVGCEGSEGADDFQVAVATPLGVNSRRDRDPFVGLVVVRFEPPAVERAIREYVAGSEAATWEGVVERLRTRMSWEY